MQGVGQEEEEEEEEEEGEEEEEEEEKRLLIQVLLTLILSGYAVGLEGLWVSFNLPSNNSEGQLKIAKYLRNLPKITIHGKA